MNGFRRLQQRLQQEGWYVGWALPCCQSCAWGSLPFEHEDGPFKGQDVDFNKVLFNHEQDCQIECDWDDNDEIILSENISAEDYDTFPHNSPEEQTSSMFCFAGDPEGVKNLTAVLPLIEESGCTYSWSGTGDQRIEIAWE